MFNARLCLPFSWFLFVKSWRTWAVLIVALAVSAPMSYQSQQRMAVCGVALFIVILLLFNSLSLADPQQTGSSYFPGYLLQLPLSDVELVLWPMLVSAVTLGAVGLLIAVCILGSLHSLSDTWWLGPYLAGTGVVFQAAYWLPMRRPEWRLSLNLVALVAIAVGPIALGFGFADSVVLSATYGMLLIASILATVRGVAKVRHGLVGAGSAKPYIIPDLPAFRSRAQSQIWLEQIRNGKVMTVLTVMFLALFTGCALVATLGSSDVIHFQGQSLSNVALFCAAVSLLLPSFVAYGGCCASETDNLAKDRSIVPFLALRPLTEEQIFEAKIRMAVRVAVRLALVQIAVAIGILLLPMNVDGRRLPTIVLLIHALTPGQAAGIAGLFVLAVLIGIKGAIAGIWASMGRLSTFSSALIGFIPLMVGIIAVMWVATHMDKLPLFLRCLPWLVWLDAGAKVAVLCWAIPKLRRRRLVSDDTIQKWLIGCAVIGAALFAFACWAIPPAVYNRPALAAQILCLLPLGRVALTPIFIHRGRHQ